MYVKRKDLYDFELVLSYSEFEQVKAIAIKENITIESAIEWMLKHQIKYQKEIHKRKE